MESRKLRVHFYTACTSPLTITGKKFGNTGKPVSMNQEILMRLKAARQGLPPHAIWLEQRVGKAMYQTAYTPHGWVA